MKLLKYLFLCLAYTSFGFGSSDKSLSSDLKAAAAASPKQASVPQTVTVYNKTPYSIYVLPSMAALINDQGQVIAGNYGNPMAGMLPAGSMGAQFSFPSQVATVYFITPSGIAGFKKDNPTAASLNPKDIYQWVSKGSQWGIYSTYPSAKITITETPNKGIEIIH